MDSQESRIFSLYNGSLFRMNSRYPRILEMELDLLSQRMATAPIVEGLPALMRRISQNQLPHGADIMIGLLTRIIRLHYANGLSMIPTPVVPITHLTGPTTITPSLLEHLISVEGYNAVLNPPDQSSGVQGTKCKCCGKKRRK